MGTVAIVPVLRDGCLCLDEADELDELLWECEGLSEGPDLPFLHPGSPAQWPFSPQAEHLVRCLSAFKRFFLSSRDKAFRATGNLPFLRPLPLPFGRLPLPL